MPGRTLLFLRRYETGEMPAFIDMFSGKRPRTSLDWHIVVWIVRYSIDMRKFVANCQEISASSNDRKKARRAK